MDLTGIERLVKETELQKRYKDKRLALLAHPASVDQDLKHSMDLLVGSKFNTTKFTVTAAFGPQHGMLGDKQDNMMESPNYIDPKYKIPIFSLYGEVRRPTAEMMEHFDVLLVDLQDVGTRIYTYITTLRYILEAGAEHKKEIVVLDRPNPAGRPIEGSLLKAGFESFVGAGPMPMRHGMTMGEMALWFKKTFQIPVDLDVIKMKKYQPEEKPGFGWPAARTWINPSPNAANVNMARAFPGTVMLEGTHLSEGRGTTRPLEIVGAPNLPIEKMLYEMNKMAPAWMKGALFRPCFFLPTFHKHQGQLCAGVQIHTDHPSYGHEDFKPYRWMALFFKVLKKLKPDYELWRDFHYEYEKDRLAIDLINGSSILREWVDEPSSEPGDFEKILLEDENKWKEERKEFLLY